MSDLANAVACALADVQDIAVVYSDVSRFSVWAGSRECTLREHAFAITNALWDRTLLVPTFNYDWCETGQYDPMSTPSQLGNLSEYFRQTLPLRTWTPIFTFSGQPWHGLFPPMMPVVDPFGPRSTFRWLIENHATVVAYGCRLRYASACHVAEREAAVPYRYVKPFSGTIEGFGEWTVDYHVRHPSVEYDWDAVDRIIAPCFTAHDVAGATVAVARADEIHAALLDALAKDEHALLREEPTALYEQYGKPLRWEKVAA